jgi:hypothetical protein
MSITRGTIAHIPHIYIYIYIYIYIERKKEKEGSKEEEEIKRGINAELNGESDHLGINIIKSHLQINDNKAYVCFAY